MCLGVQYAGLRRAEGLEADESGRLCSGALHGRSVDEVAGLVRCDAWQTGSHDDTRHDRSPTAGPG